MEERFLKPPTPEATTDLAASGDGAASDDSDGEFEFPFVSRDSSEAADAAADELFADGRIRPFYPVFGRAVVAAPEHPAPVPARKPLGRLFLEEGRNSSVGSTSTASSSDSSAAELEGVSPESYCVWTPGASRSASAASSPSRPQRKSSSTGSMARWRRISELVIGRSHSDGKEKFVFLSPSHAAAAARHHHHHKEENPKAKSSTTGGAGGGRKARAEMAYGVARPGGGAAQRTFLPYRPELVGLFANVNGLSRSHNHPF